MSDSDLPVVYEDTALLVIEKPAGLLSVPGRGADKQDCVSTRIKMGYSDALVVHRLDMATSGLMIMARGIAAQRALNAAFASCDILKRYIAVVNGRLSVEHDEWNVIDLPILLDWPNRPLRIIDKALGKPSVTRWRALADSPLQTVSRIRETDTTRLELEPLTGRSHQLRVHLKYMGHPIVGDTLYAHPESLVNSDRLLLHACSLILTHPFTGQALQFYSPPAF
ncbi:MAG: hypothetical protein RL211_2279 [Pseudomonadota bacterium]|jgi:tRNA pseudouridine32 synthase/23S rRNA pseudouridine746 synthase